MSSHGSRILIASIKPIVPVVRGPFKYRVAVLQAEERQRKREGESGGPRVSLPFVPEERGEQRRSQRCLEPRNLLRETANYGDAIS